MKGSAKIIIISFPGTFLYSLWIVHYWDCFCLSFQLAHHTTTHWDLLLSLTWTIHLVVARNLCDEIIHSLRIKQLWKETLMHFFGWRGKKEGKNGAKSSNSNSIRLSGHCLALMTLLLDVTDFKSRCRSSFQMENKVGILYSIIVGRGGLELEWVMSVIHIGFYWSKWVWVVGGSGHSFQFMVRFNHPSIRVYPLPLDFLKLQCMHEGFLFLCHSRWFVRLAIRIPMSKLNDAKKAYIFLHLQMTFLWVSSMRMTTVFFIFFLWMLMS